MYETFMTLKRDFEKTQDDIEVTIDGGGSRTGLVAISKDEVDIGLSSFGFDLTEFLGVDHGIQEQVVAHDGIVLISNEHNPLHQLTNEQIEGIYSGRIKDWSEIGGTSGRILPVVRDQNSGTQKYFTSYFDVDQVAPYAVIANNNAEIVAKVEADDYSLGFIGFAYHTVSVNDILLPSAVDDSFIPPSHRTLLNGQYPLKRSLRIYYHLEHHPAVSEFLSYLETARARNIIEAQGLIAHSARQSDLLTLSK